MVAWSYTHSGLARECRLPLALFRHDGHSGLFLNYSGLAKECRLPLALFRHDGHSGLFLNHSGLARECGLPLAFSKHDGHSGFGSSALVLGGAVDGLTLRGGFPFDLKN